jgi:hypothetical protein
MVQNPHWCLDFGQLVDEFHGEALEEGTVIVDSVLMIERTHLVVIVPVCGVAVGVYQLGYFLFVEQGLQTCIHQVLPSAR